MTWPHSCSTFSVHRSPTELDVHPTSASTIAGGMRSGDDNIAFASTTCCLSILSARPFPIPFLNRPTYPHTSTPHDTALGTQERVFGVVQRDRWC
jgi:hypothetical protein